MKRQRIPLIASLIALLVLLTFTTPPSQAEDNPKSYVAAASGANVALAAATDKTYFISSITFAASHQSTAVVGVHVTSGDRNVIGSSAASIPIDKTGLAGYGGITLTHEGGYVATGKKGEAITINLSAAQPVIVQITYTLR